MKPKILEAISAWLYGRELWLGDGSPRPLKAENEQELKTLIDRYGSDDIFPIFLSVEVFSDPLKLNKSSAEHLRVSWDFFLDIDSEKFDYTKRAAKKLLKLLEYFNIGSYILKFSGRRGFHLLIPGLCFDIFRPGEFKYGYPKLPLMVAKFLSDSINEPHVKVDFAVYKPRQLFRSVYSLHEKTGLVSVPVQNPLDFRASQARPEKLKIETLDSPEPKVGEAADLLKAANEWRKSSEKKNGIQIVKMGEYSQRPIKGYRWIERLLLHPVDDGRHRLLWLVIAPYLVNVKKLSLNETKQKALEYLRACNEVKPIDGNIVRLVDYYVDYAYRKRLRPISLRNLRTKFPDLYEIIKKASTYS